MILIIGVSLISATLQLAFNTFLTVQRYKEIDQQHKSSSQNSPITYELSYIFNILSQILNMFEITVFLFGVIRFLYKDYDYEISKERKIFRTLKCYKVCLGLIGLIVLFIISFFPPAFLSHPKSWNNTAPYFANATIGQGSVGTEWMSHLYTYITRCLMICATLYVRTEWLNTAEKIKEITKDATRNISKSKFQILIRKYKHTGNIVSAYQEIFQAWFVVKWMTYFIEISAYSTTSLKKLSSDTSAGVNEAFWFAVIHLLYDISAFLTIYSCGSLMNYYHNIFYKQMEEEQEKYLAQTHHWPMQYATIIRRQQNYQFTPSICGIDIPMDNPGYTLTLLLSLFAFVANFFGNAT